jgi:hypothetical protein
LGQAIIPPLIETQREYILVMISPLSS